MTMLHTVNKSPFEKGSLESCLRVAREGSAVLLIEDGVYAALAHGAAAAPVREALAKLRIYALEPDVQARGLEPERLIEGIELVGYGEFVDLAAAHDSVQAWL